MLGRGILDSLKLKGKEFVFERIRNNLPIADGTIGNLEAPLTKEGKIVKGKPVNLTFKIDPEYVSVLEYLRISSVTLANNHITDYGVKGIETTINTLIGHNITYTGISYNLKEALKPITFFDKESQQKIGVFAFNAFTPFSVTANIRRPGSARFDRNSLNFALREFKGKVDGIIIVLHWGIDYESFPIPRLLEIVKQIIDNYPEVIAIIGHHPHLLQPIIEYKGRPIFCSIGNFAFDEPFPLSRIGCILTLEILNKCVANYSITYTQLEHTQRLSLLPYSEVIKEETRLQTIKRLMEEQNKEFLKVDKKWIKYLLYQAIRYCSINDLKYMFELYSFSVILKNMIRND